MGAGFGGHLFNRRLALLTARAASASVHKFLFGTEVVALPTTLGHSHRTEQPDRVREVAGVSFSRWMGRGLSSFPGGEAAEKRPNSSVETRFHRAF